MINNGDVAYLFLSNKFMYITNIRHLFKRFFLLTIILCYLLVYKLYKVMQEYQRNSLPVVMTWGAYWIIYNFVVINIGCLMYRTSKVDHLFIYVHGVIPTSACLAVCSSAMVNLWFFEKCVEIIWMNATDQVYNEVLETFPLLGCGLVYYILQMRLYHYGTLLLDAVQCSQQEYEELCLIGFRWDANSYIL